MRTLDILGRLISFETVSPQSNLDLIHFVRDLLSSAGATVDLIHHESGKKANLYATLGPADLPGILLSGHTDVVPVEGQEWTVPPFQMTTRGDAVFGRGAADMKGFLACAIVAALHGSSRSLRTPLHLALSYDEEIGCIGVRSLIDMLQAAPFRPALCIVGEPTSLAVATGHKGKTGLRAICRGREGHSALAPFALNAIHLATGLVGEIRRIQERIASGDSLDDDYDVPYTTLHVGKIAGGVALNIVPNHCQLDFEIRNIAQDDPTEILNEIKSAATRISADARKTAPEAAIDIEVFNAYPGLNTPEGAEVVAFVKSLTGANGTIKVAFGTEGGLFSSQLGIPTVVCGPGSMAQGHKPDEFVSLEQLSLCDAMLVRLVDRLEAGL